VSLFDDIKESAEGRELSTRWYRSKITSLGGTTMTAEQHIEEGYATAKPNYGMMNLFHYQPQTAEKLPFYDLFPLVIPVEKNRDGFTGINFHFLSIPMRVAFLNLLTEAFADDRMEKLNLTWRQISGLGKSKVTVRRYKARNVKSMFLRIPVEDMLIAVLLPVQRFYSGDLDSKRRVSSEVVYNKIRSM